MTYFRLALSSRRRLASLALGLLISPALWAQDAAPANVAADSARAAALRKQAAAMHTTALQKQKDERKACASRFLVNYCRDKADDRYLEAAKKARAVDADAAQIEQDIRRRELAERDAKLAQERAKHDAKLGAAPATAPSQPGKGLPPSPVAKPVTSTPPNLPRPSGTPVSPDQAAQREIERLSERAKMEQDAALRAQKAREDAARYEKRRAELAAKKAKRGASELPPLQQQGGEAAAAPASNTPNAPGLPPAPPPPPPTPGTNPLPNIPPPPPPPPGG